jgi:hypothetical protein
VSFSASRLHFVLTVRILRRQQTPVGGVCYAKTGVAEIVAGTVVCPVFSLGTGSYGRITDIEPETSKKSGRKQGIQQCT